jgi:hypothetical protein
MPDQQRFDRPLFVLRNGKFVEDNVKEFLEWRKRADPEAYRAAMRQLVEVIAEVTVRACSTPRPSMAGAGSIANVLRAE